MAPLFDAFSYSTLAISTWHTASSQTTSLLPVTAASSRTNNNEIDAISYFTGFGLAIFSTILLGVAYICTKHALARNDKLIARTLIQPVGSAPPPSPSSSTSGSARTDSPAPLFPPTIRPSSNQFAPHSNGPSHRQGGFASSDNPLPSVSTSAPVAPRLASEGGVGYLREPIWWFGTVLMASGEACNFAAYLFAPATLVTPLGGLTVLFAAFLSHHFLKEQLNVFGQLGCGCSLLGAVLVVVNAPHDREVKSVEELAHMLSQIGVILYLVALLALVMALVFFLGPRWGSRTPVVYVALTSLLGSVTVMCCKALGVALSQTFRILDSAEANAGSGAAGVGEHATSPPPPLPLATTMSEAAVRLGVLSVTPGAATHPLTWIALVMLVPCILAQLYYLNRGLASFDAGLVAPIQYVFFTVAVLALSALVYHEWGALKTGPLLSVLVGFLIITVGIFMLATSKRVGLVIWIAHSQSSGACADRSAASASPTAHGGRYRTATWRRLLTILVDQSEADPNSSKPPPRPELCVSCIIDRPPPPPPLTDSDTVAAATPCSVAAVVEPASGTASAPTATATETAPLISAPTLSPHHLHLKWATRRRSNSSEYGALQLPFNSGPIASPPHVPSNSAIDLT